MVFFEFKLIPRLILASSVLAAAAVFHWFALWLYPGGQHWIGYLWYSWTPPFLDLAFGLLVLAPFVTADSKRWIRVIALILVSGVVYFSAVVSVASTQFVLQPWIDSQYMRFVSMVPTAIIATWMLAGATAWVAPLRISRRFWIYTGLAGLISGLVFLGADILSNLQDYIDTEWLYYLPFWLWPIATCVAIHSGQDQELLTYTGRVNGCRCAGE